MASLALINATTYLAGYDFTTDTNQISINASAEELDTTTFGGGGYKSRIGGLKDVTAQLGGFWQSATTDAVDPQVFTNFGTADQVVTFSPTGVAAETAYIAQLGKFKYELGGEIGAVMPFTLDMSGTSAQGLVRGQLAAAKQNKSATGALGSGLQLGAVGATQYLYASFHIFSVGTTITVVLESDDNSGFSSATTRATIGPLTAAGGTWVPRVAGAITDDYFRFRITAITGTFSVGGAIAVGS